MQVSGCALSVCVCVCVCVSVCVCVWLSNLHRQRNELEYHINSLFTF